MPLIDRKLHSTYIGSLRHWHAKTSEGNVTIIRSASKTESFTREAMTATLPPKDKHIIYNCIEYVWYLKRSLPNTDLYVTDRFVTLALASAMKTLPRKWQILQFRWNTFIRATVATHLLFIPLRPLSLFLSLSSTSHSHETTANFCALPLLGK